MTTDEIKTVDLTPNIRVYTNMLLVIVENNKNPVERKWAKDEISRVIFTLANRLKEEGVEVDY